MAFRDLVDPLRTQLHAHCYRMLGSAADADDALQEVLLRAWRGLRGSRGAARCARGSTGSRRTSASRCSSGGRSGRCRSTTSRTTEDGLARALPERGARVRAARERRARVRRRAPAPAAQRARGAARPRGARPVGAGDRGGARDHDGRGQQRAAAGAAVHGRAGAGREPAGRAADARRRRVQRLVGDYADALERGDVEGVLGLLSEDATWSMPPLAEWYRGHDAIRAFLLAGRSPRWRHVPVLANGQPAVGCYLWSDGGPLRGLRDRRPHAPRRPDRGITAFIDAAHFPRFGLPHTCPPEAGPAAQPVPSRARLRWSMPRPAVRVVRRRRIAHRIQRRRLLGR